VSKHRQRLPRTLDVENGGAVFLALSGFFLVGLRQTFTVPFTRGHGLGQALLLIIAGLWVLTRLQGQRSQIRCRPLVIAMLLLAIASLVSYASTVDGMSPTARQYSDENVFNLIALIATAMAIIALLTTTDRVTLVLKGLLLGGSLSASFAIIQFLTGMDLAGQFRLPGLRAGSFPLVEQLIVRQGVIRAQGSAAHPLELGVVLTMLVPLGIGVVTSARAKGEKTWPWVVCTVFLVCGALVTVSRSVVIGLAAAILVMAWRWPIRRLAATLTGITLVLALGWIYQIRLANAFATSFETSSSDPSLKSRMSGRTYVFAHYREHLWFGEGPGTYSTYRHRPILDNEYLTKLIDVGMLGLATYVVLLCVALVLALRASAAASNAIAELAGGVSGSIVVLIVAEAIFDISGFQQSWYLAWFIIALTGVMSYISRNGDVVPINHSYTTAAGQRKMAGVNMAGE
jgi:putative inorganic carbon (HCO3(-)) transporter